MKRTLSTKYSANKRMRVSGEPSRKTENEKLADHTEISPHSLYTNSRSKPTDCERELIYYYM